MGEDLLISSNMRRDPRLAHDPEAVRVDEQEYEPAVSVWLC
jgi:hypothetical protein